MNYITDVSLYNKENDTVNAIIEICPGTRDKKELIEPYFNELITVRQVEGVYPFYYGSFPQTYAGDKDPLDLILFTDKEHSELDLVKVDVIGAIKTIDAGEQDDKIICIEHDSSILNAKKYLKKALKFLRQYKGKHADMTISKSLASMSEADTLVKQAHEAWKEHTKPKKVAMNNSVSTGRNQKIRVIRR